MGKLSFAWVTSIPRRRPLQAAIDWTRGLYARGRPAMTMRCAPAFLCAMLLALQVSAGERPDRVGLPPEACGVWS